MITYSQIENLPADHPLVKQFEEEVAALDKAYTEAGEMDSKHASQYPVDPEVGDAEWEASLEYFDRYITGDR